MVARQPLQSPQREYNIHCEHFDSNNYLVNKCNFPFQNRNTSPVTGRNSVFQNDNAITNEINVEPPPQIMSAANIQV